MSNASALSPQAKEALRRTRRHFAPSERMTAMTWARRRRVLHSGPLAGNGFDWDETPALKGIIAAYHEPGIEEIWVRKSAQIGFTQGVYMNLIGYHVELDPCPIGILFAKDGAGKRFMREKLEPMIRATPVLLERIPLEARSAANTQDYKRFPGGFIQLAGTRSAANVKSTDLQLVIVEEPDDTDKNVQGQGDSIALGRERYKSYPNGKMLVGGTPTIKGLSKIDAGMERTDKRMMFIACPHCGHEQTLRWSQVTWKNDADIHHPIYGTHRPDTARYACEACGIDGQDAGFWTDEQKRLAVIAASNGPDYGWRKTGLPSRYAGFIVSELYSSFAGSRMAVLVQKFLEASHALKNGDDSLMKSFVNNTLGECWEIKGNSPEREELIERGEDYPEWTCPAGALIADCFVDVQRGGEQSGAARLHYLVVGWGRGMEAWVIARGVVLGNPLESATWNALDTVLAAQPIRNLGGGTLPISLIGIDSGDGLTQEAVYGYVRAKQRQGRKVIATKGSNQRGKPIFSLPKAQDATHNDRAARWGLKLYQIGTETAKDTLLARLKLFEHNAEGRAIAGRGDGRLHWPAAIGEEFVDQITSEVKVPNKNGRLEYVVKAGARNEDLDCFVGCLHGAYKLRLHQYTESHWQAVEIAVRQRDLLDGPTLPAPATPPADGGAESRPAPARPQPFRGYR